MKLEAFGLLLCTALVAGFATTAQADVHVGIGIGVVPPVVVAPPVYYVPPDYDAPPPPLDYGPGIVIGAWGGEDWRDRRGHDDRWGHERRHERGGRRR